MQEIQMKLQKYFLFLYYMNFIIKIIKPWIKMQFLENLIASLIVFRDHQLVLMFLS